MSIITHSDTFHCDEVMACAMLKFLYSDMNIIRTRDQSIIESKSDDSIVIDVGKIYDHERKFYDHHQTSFEQSFSDEYTVYMSSCGLIWLHYGRDIINKLLNSNSSNNATDTHVTIDTEYIFNKFYKIFVFPIDCNDNGESNDYKKNVYIPIELSDIVGSFNGFKSTNHKLQMVNFMSAMQMCQYIFINKLTKMILSSVNYATYLESFLTSWNLRQNDYLIIESEQMPIHSYLAKYDPDQMMKFIIVCRSSDDYRLWTINRKGGQRFDILLPLISEITARALPHGTDVIFIHKACFTGACKTLESAISVIENSIPKSKFKQILDSIFSFVSNF